MTSAYWLDYAPPQTRRTTPELPQRTQVAVIGGGLTGASLAYWLRTLGADVVLLERRGLSGGATGRNGGHLVAGPALDFGQAVRRYGAGPAAAIYRFTLDTLADLQAFISQHAIDCDLTLGGFASLAYDAADLARLEASAAELARHNLPFAWWGAAECAKRTGSTRFLGGLFNPAAVQLWPAKLVLGIAAVAEGLGANIQTQTEVTEVTRDGAALCVATPRGHVRAEAVVYAANAWAPHLLPELQGLLVPVRGQVVVSEPVPPLWQFGWGTNHGYEYCLQRPDGRIVLGGMRWKSSTLELNAASDETLHANVSAALRGFLPAYFPALARLKIEQEWAGLMAFTPDHNPLVGPLPNRPRQYLAGGYSGHGMPIAFNAARAVAQALTGRAPALTLEAFSPHRFL